MTSSAQTGFNTSPQSGQRLFLVTSLTLIFLTQRLETEVNTGDRLLRQILCDAVESMGNETDEKRYGEMSSYGLFFKTRVCVVVIQKALSFLIQTKKIIPQIPQTNRCNSTLTSFIFLFSFCLTTPSLFFFFVFAKYVHKSK